MCQRLLCQPRFKDLGIERETSRAVGNAKVQVRISKQQDAIEALQEQVAELSLEVEQLRTDCSRLIANAKAANGRSAGA